MSLPENLYGLEKPAKSNKKWNNSSKCFKLPASYLSKSSSCCPGFAFTSIKISALLNPAWHEYMPASRKVISKILKAPFLETLNFRDLIKGSSGGQGFTLHGFLSDGLALGHIDSGRSILCSWAMICLHSTLRSLIP
uniref:Uncharacterized protein n=1 Tax=Glossina brevipalpis TaxID=37001 RepID=A0A1A9W5G7_9MUSC